MSARLRSHGREHQRLHVVHRRDGSDPGAPPRAGAAPGAAGSRAGRQGLQLPCDTNLAQASLHRPYHPRAGRPGPQPAPARQPGRTPAKLRQAALQAARRCGTVLQPAQAVARHRDPLRQDRRACGVSATRRATAVRGVPDLYRRSGSDVRVSPLPGRPEPACGLWRGGGRCRARGSQVRTGCAAPASW